MLFKALLIICFLAVVISLASSFFFLMKDHSQKKRMVHALFVRVGLSALLIVMIIYGYYTNYLSLSPPF